MTIQTHICIKPGCENSYQDEDSERYYCPSCLREKKSIAAEVDRKVGSTVGQQPNGLYAQYERAQKSRGLVRAEDLMNFSL